MKEDKSIFLKVDCVEPVYGTSPFSYSWSSGGAPYLKGIKVWIDGDGHLFECDHYTVCDPDVVREDGRQQVVALAKELSDMNIADRDKLFGYHTVTDLVTKFSYDGVVEKLDTWKKEKETIHVRDEVANINNGTKFVVTVPPRMSSNSVEYMSGIGKDGKVYKDVVAAAYKKTGVRVDSIDAYLEV